MNPIPEERFFDFTCPYCEADLSFLDTFAGTAQSCPECQESIVVPSQGTPVGGRLPIPVTTHRLVLRRFQPGDWKDLLELMSNEEGLRHVDAPLMDEAAVLRWLEADRAARLTQPRQPFCLGMELQGKNKLIGYTSISCQDETHLQAGFGVVVHPDFRDYGSEAVGGLLRFSFAGIALHRLNTSCDSRDAAYRQMLEAAGLRCEGEFLKDRFVNGEWVNTAWYALLREEYERWPKV
jgi:RimJ/RimL family protein N-acetyltransferase